MYGIEHAQRLIAGERERKTGVLDLGNLGLTALPPEIFELTHLKSLVFGSQSPDGRNSIVLLPPALGRLQALESLSLCWTPVRDLAPLLGLTKLQSLDLRLSLVTDLGPLWGLTSLQTLNLGNIGVSDLEPLRSLTGLRSLNLASTQVSDLAPLGNLAGLQTLDLGRTGVSDLGPLRGLRDLRSLNLAFTHVSDLAPLLGLMVLQTLDLERTSVMDLGPLQGLVGLRTLNLEHTGVRDAGPLQNLRELQTLNLGNTGVEDLGPLQSLTGLQTLDLGYSGVSDLRRLQGLTRLRTLDLQHTQISDLAPLQGLPALQSLNCGGMPVSNLEPLRGLTALRSLVLREIHMSDLDLTPLEGLTSLQSLDCTYTPAVKDLGPLRGLKNLNSLSLGETQVLDLGPLRGLVRLESLNIWSTAVRDLGPLQDLSRLEWLSLDDTQVSDLGPLHGLTELSSLLCPRTRVGDLEPLRGLTGLRSLDCSETHVNDLTPLIGLPRLRQVEANHLRLTDLPRALVMKESLAQLTLFQTTVQGLPGEIASAQSHDNCLERVRDHLRDLEAGAEEVREAKLVLVGNGRVGKTQICRRLRGLAYDDRIPSTHGITVTSEKSTGSPGDDALNIWDFGGQDIYHGAHTLFMQTSAVFMIAWHPDFESAGEQSLDGVMFRNYPLSYWLAYVRTLGRKDCPVVVVQTRCERPEQELRRLPVDDRFQQFRSLKPCWYSKTDRGRGALNDAVKDAIEFLRERDGIATIGAGRMRVMRQLEAWRNEDQVRTAHDRQHRTLSQGEFRALCETIGGVRSPESLLEYLHNVGVVFYRPNLFSDRIILDQSWALEAVYAVFDRRKAFPLILSQGGRFTRSLLAMTAWSEFSEPEQRLFLSLMESCGISFVHRAADRRLQLETEYLAPDLLPGKDAVGAQLAGRWNDTEETWRVEYEYPFLHPGLMRALICDVGRRSHEAGVYWKYGLWVYEKDTGCRALLEQHMTDERRGRITLQLQGHRHEELARWLLERIDDHNRRFGLPELAPAVDEFRDRLRAVGMHSSPYRHTESATRPPSVTTTSVTEAESAPVSREPVFDRPPAGFFPSRESQVFVSYAWGDDTAEGRERQRVVDDLCAALGKEGIKVRRDRDEMRPGGLISEFMDRLAEGDFIITVISDKYLRSEYCMYELFRIYRNCADKPERFLGKVIPLILADAELGSLAERLQRAIHWTNQETELQPLIQGNLPAVGTAFYAKFKLIGEFARNTSNMLEHLIDKLMPRDFDRMAAQGFREVRRLIGATPPRPGA